ncbi:hypothetical protein [Actinomycetospora atypica]|uniref:Uncharacterized protein n=1 Tax=Actinomycetospora atypica TaxID=1290095 RepID=A0ABV9YP72_9PSEU
MASTGTDVSGRPESTEETGVDVVRDTSRVETNLGLATTRRGRLAVSAFLIVLLGTVLVANMPKSVVKASIAPWTQPVLVGLGFEQNWGVFSPDPRMDTSEVIARVRYVDGGTMDRTIEADPWIGEYRDYRWRKYEEQLWASRDGTRAFLPYARWLTSDDTAAGRHVREVEIIRRTRPSLPPGPGPDYGPWQDLVLGKVTGAAR